MMPITIIVVVGLGFMMAAMSASVNDVNNRLMDLQDDLSGLDGRLRDQESRLQNAINEQEMRLQNAINELASRINMNEERGDDNRNL